MRLDQYELMIKRGGDRGGGGGGGRRADRSRVRGGMANPGARGGQSGQAAAAAGRGDTGGGASQGQSNAGDFTIGQTQGTAFDAKGQALAKEADADFGKGVGAVAAGEVTGQGGGAQPGAKSGMSNVDDFTIGETQGTAFGPTGQVLAAEAEQDFNRGVGATGTNEVLGGSKAAAEVADKETQRAATGVVSTALFDDTFGPVQESQLAASTDVAGDGVGPKPPKETVGPSDVPAEDRGKGNGVVARQIATGDVIRTGGAAGSGAVIREGLRAATVQRERPKGRGRGIGPSRRSYPS